MPTTAFYEQIEQNKIDVKENKAEHATRTKKSDTQKIGFTFGELLALELPEREEIIFGLGRGEIGTINAVGNAGKTTLLRNLTVSLCTGKPFAPLGNFNLPKRVAFLDFEDTLTFLRQDLRVMLSAFSDADKARLNDNALLICDVRLDDEDLSLSNTFHLAQITNRLKSFAPDLIIVDTISSAFQIRNENDNAEVRTFVMRILKRLAKDCNAGVIAAHHIGKAKSEEGAVREASHKGRGASSFADMSRIVLNLEKDAADPKSAILSCPKVKGQKFADTILKLDTETRWFKSAGEKHEPTNYEIVLEFFADGKEHSTKDVVSEFEGEMSERTVKGYIRQAEKRKELTKKSHGKYQKCKSADTIRDCTFALSNKSNNHSHLQTQTEKPEKTDCTLPNCQKCGLEMQSSADGETVFCPFGCGSFKPAERQISK